MTAKQFLEERQVKGDMLDLLSVHLQDFAKYHAQAIIKAVKEKVMIDRQPTGEGESSESYTSNSFEGYEDYIPVEYTINKKSIENAYPLSNIT